jgi:carbohydrate ABC transporter substrate-binding protein, CUT1 family (TC 3.A.1.1.-)
LIRTAQRTLRRRGLGQALVIGLVLALMFGGWAWARAPITVRVLMPAPFADATAGLVNAFNREHRDLRIAVTRGPFETESVSDLAVSSLLLGDSPYDLLLMDVTWTAKYAAAGWLLPLDPWLGPEPLESLAPGPGSATASTASSGACLWWQIWDCSTGAPT